MKAKIGYQYCKMCGKHISHTYEDLCSRCYYKSYRIMKAFFSVIERKYDLKAGEYLDMDIFNKVDVSEIFCLQKYWTRKSFTGHCKYCQTSININDGLLICDGCFSRLIRTRFSVANPVESKERSIYNHSVVKKFKKSDAMQIRKGNPYQAFLLKRRNCEIRENKN